MNLQNLGSLFDRTEQVSRARNDQVRIRQTGHECAGARGRRCGRPRGASFSVQVLLLTWLCSCGGGAGWGVYTVVQVGLRLGPILLYQLPEFRFPLGLQV